MIYKQRVMFDSVIVPFVDWFNFYTISGFHSSLTAMLILFLDWHLVEVGSIASVSEILIVSIFKVKRLTHVYG
jgi:hypothetical protein